MRTNFKPLPEHGEGELLEEKKTSFIVRAHFNKINPFMHDLIFLNFLLLFIVCYYMNEWKYNNITRNMKEHISPFFVEKNVVHTHYLVSVEC